MIVHCNIIITHYKSLQKSLTTHNVKLNITWLKNRFGISHYTQYHNLTRDILSFGIYIYLYISCQNITLPKIWRIVKYYKINYITKLNKILIKIFS